MSFSLSEHIEHSFTFRESNQPASERVYESARAHQIEEKKKKKQKKTASFTGIPLSDNAYLVGLLFSSNIYLFIFIYKTFIYVAQQR